MSRGTVTREYHETAIDKKSGCIADLRAERDALRDSLQSMVEYAEEYSSYCSDAYGAYRKDYQDKVKAEIAKARGLLK